MKEWFEVTGEEVPSGTHFLIDTEPGEKVILMGGSIFDKIEPRALISNLSFSFGVSQVRILDSHDHVPPGIDEE